MFFNAIFWFGVQLKIDWLNIAIHETLAILSSLDKINEVINANCTLPLLAILKISRKSYIISSIIILTISCWIMSVVSLLQQISMTTA